MAVLGLVIHEPALLGTHGCRESERERERERERTKCKDDMYTVVKVQEAPVQLSFEAHILQPQTYKESTHCWLIIQGTLVYWVLLTMIPANILRTQCLQLVDVDGWLPWVRLHHKLSNINPFKSGICCVGLERERERERKVNCLLLTHVHMRSMFTKLLLIYSPYQNHSLSLNINKHPHRTSSTGANVPRKLPQAKNIHTYATHRWKCTNGQTHIVNDMYSPRSQLALHPWDKG